ncbi:MAG: hypothetical protein WKF87_22360 [Chryseolinea sp.]
MKKQTQVFLVLAVMAVAFSSHAQGVEGSEGSGNAEIQTVFKGNKFASGGYGAFTNKFTNINGQFANLAGIYGGWYVNHNFFIGAGASALTNDIRVPFEYRTDPLKDLSYMYGQVGMVNEYIVASNKPVHVAFSLFSGAGFTLQYEIQDWHTDDHHEMEWDGNEDVDWFFVAEPGVMVEVNVFKWMRFSPGISYRATFGSDGKGLSDNKLSDISYNATLKFGKF